MAAFNVVFALLLISLAALALWKVIGWLYQLITGRTPSVRFTEKDAPELFKNGRLRDYRDGLE